MSGTYVIWPPPPTGGGGGGSGVVTVGSMDAQVASVNGASISGTTIFMQSATGSSTGLVNISAQSFGGKKTFSAGLDSAANAITNVLDPSNPQDAATKNYVDTQLSAFEPKEATYAATIGNLGGTYLNGAAGVGATFTIASTGAFALDGTSPPAGSRILFKDQTTGFQNGIYDLTVAGSGILQPVLTRSLDYNTPAAIDAGDLIPVINGTINQRTSWLQTNNVATVGVDSLIFTQYSANPLNVPSAMGPLDGAAASPNGATIGSSSLYLQSASATNPGIVSSFTQTFAGVKTFNAQILATGGIGLGTIGSGTIAILSVGADANTRYIVIGSTSVAGFYPRIGLQMNNPQASIHFGSLNGNVNTTSGVVGSFSVVLGGLNATAAVGLGAFIAGGTGGLNTASGQDSSAIGYNCVASGIGAIAGGYANTASGNFSAGFGAAASARQDGSCTLGYTAQTIIAGGNQRSVAIGESAAATGNSSVAIGFHISTLVSGQVALGTYNLTGTGSLTAPLGSTDEVLVVGIGTAAGNANGLSVTRDGGVRHYTSSGTAYVAIYVGTTTSYAVTLPGTQGSTSASALVNNGAGALSWQPTGALTVQTFSSGSGAYAPSPGVKGIKITAIGGGGGGGGCAITAGSQSSAAGGGAGASTSIKWITVASLTASYFYYVADGGGGGAAGQTNGTAGSSSTFYSVSSTTAVIAVGGRPGIGSGAGSAGGYTNGGNSTSSATSTGDVIFYGGSGGAGSAFSGALTTGSTNNPTQAGFGGNSYMGSGAYGGQGGAQGANSVGFSGNKYGGGGSGAFSIGSGGASFAGGNGAAGVIIVEEYYY